MATAAAAAHLLRLSQGRGGRLQLGLQLLLRMASSHQRLARHGLVALRGLLQRVQLLAGGSQLPLQCRRLLRVRS